MTDLLELIHTRRSIRRYTDQAVPPELVARLLSAAVWAPSACFAQAPVLNATTS